MRRLLRHALFIVAFLLGGDGFFNDGRETDNVLEALRTEAIAGQAKLQGYHFNSGLSRQFAVLSPQ